MFVYVVYYSLGCIIFILSDRIVPCVIAYFTSVLLFGMRASHICSLGFVVRFCEQFVDI